MADVVIGLIIYLLMKFTGVSKFVEIIFLGLALAYINLALSNFYANRMLRNKKFIFFYLHIEILGVVGMASIAYIFYLNDSIMALIFLGGYCTHFISLVVIAFKDLIKQ